MTRKSHRIIFFGGLLLTIAFSAAKAQGLKKLKEFKPGKIENVSVDRLGNFFLIFKNGSIKKYDANGNVLASLKNMGGEKSLALIEPWFYPKIFAYSKKNQQLVSYDRNFKNPTQQKIDPSVAIRPLLACPTNDNKVLVLDGADLSIKKVNPFNSEVLNEFYLDSAQTKTNFTYLREYQNLIFLLDKNSGLLILSNIGKEINRIPCQSNFGFYGEELFFIEGDKLVFFDLYTEKRREEVVGNGKFVMVTDERIVLVTNDDRVILFEYLSKGD